MYLNCHSYYSFKYGTLSVTDLLSEAQVRGITSLALTDINNTSACLDFIRLAKDYGVRPVVGIDFRKGTQLHYIAIARNNLGFHEINKHLSQVNIGEEDIFDEAPFFEHVWVIYPFATGKKRNLRANEFIGVRPEEVSKLLFSDWKNHAEKLVALCTVTFRNKRDFNAHRLLRAIDNNIVLSKLPLSEQAKGTELFLSEKDMQHAYAHFPFLIENAQFILNNSEIYFDFGKSKNKKTYTGSRTQDMELLRRLCYEGLAYRYDKATTEVLERAEHELKVIDELGFCSYFLINWDIVRYAQHKGYFYVGRGSGANSLVAYCLKITDVNPVDLDLYFERFINPYRTSPPDFDLDFSWKDRDDITRYIFEKYGTEYTALLATYSTFQSRSVIRELGKVFGLPKVEIDELVAFRKQKNTPDHIAVLIHKYSKYIHDFPSHLSIHSGGILISDEPIHNYTATSFPPKEFPVTQFSMLEAEDIGLYKFDVLSQRGLGHIKDTIAIVKRNYGVDIDIRNVSKLKEDGAIKKLIRDGKTIGCFYVESPAMRMLLRKLKTDTYLGLVAASSIIRPGVARSGMMKEYILRSHNPERRQYIHPRMGELMRETYGIMVYQEDVIRVAHYFAGLSLAQADVLRRGMSGKFRSRDEFQRIRDDFFSNCKAKEYSDGIIHEVWRQIESFAGYSFSKGHSASYAVESYQSLFLKAHYPKEFMVAVINNFGGFYDTEVYVHEARMSGAIVYAPCINKSEHLTSIKDDVIYLGFVHLGDTNDILSKRILYEREERGLFKDLSDFLLRIEISVDQLRIFIRIGAFRFTGKNKKELLWEVHKILGAKKRSKTEKELFPIERKEFMLPELYHHQLDDAIDEIEILGFPLCSPFKLLQTEHKSDCRISELHNHVGKTISLVGYYVTQKTTQTITGDFMSFGTFLDEHGDFIDTTHFPNELKNYPFRGGGCYLIKGKVAEEFGFCSIEVSFMEKLPLFNRD